MNAATGADRRPSAYQDLRSPDARDAATRPAHPRPSVTPTAGAGKGGDGIDTATIALGVAASLLAVGAIAGIANRARRTQRRRVTA